MSYLAAVSSTRRVNHPYGPVCDMLGIGEESSVLADRCITIAYDFETPFTRFWSNPYIQFHTYRDQWEDDTQYCSSTTDMAMHPAYQKIIGMGEKALPLILKELKSRPSHWFWALKAISGEDPVRPEQRGRVKQMADAWLRWGEEKGII